MPLGLTTQPHWVHQPGQLANWALLCLLRRPASAYLAPLPQIRPAPRSAPPLGRPFRTPRRVADRRGQHGAQGGSELLRRRVVEVHTAAGAVAVEAVPHVQVLVEMVAQREVE